MPCLIWSDEVIKSKIITDINSDSAKEVFREFGEEMPDTASVLYEYFEDDMPSALFVAEKPFADECGDVEDDCLYVKAVIRRQKELSVILTDLKKELGRLYAGCDYILYSYTCLDAYAGGTGFRKLYEDYLYRLPPAGEGFRPCADNDVYKVFFVETDDDSYFVTVDDSDNFVKDIAYCDLFVYDKSMCIADVFTVPEYRRLGLAGLLIDSIRSRYFDKELTLHTESDNPAACALYEKKGFEKEQIIYNYGESEQ